MSIILRPRSVRAKAVVGSCVAMAIFGFGIGLAAYIVVTQAATTSATSALESQAGQVRDQLSEHQSDESEKSSDDSEGIDLDTITSTSPTFIQVVGADGAVIAASPTLADSDRICPQPLPQEAMADRTTVQLAAGPIEVVRYVAPVDTKRGSVAVCAVASSQSIEKAQSAVLLTLLIAIPLLVLAVCIVVWFAVGRALGAVADMTTQADAMQSSSDGELRIRETGDEVERLGRTLNALLARLHQQTRATRQFVADAGHELRNPLSTLRVTLEFGEDADENGLRSSVRDAIGDLDRLEVLVNDLLILARTDAMEAPVQVEDLDVDALVSDAVASARRGRPDLDYQYTGQTCVVRGSGPELRSLLTNLLDNASRHARSEVSAKVSVAGAMVVISIDDDGVGLRAEDCERVFERFVRLDAARDRDEGGSGLGLAIVASIASSLGGQASAAPGPGGHFTVSLPKN